MKNHLVLVFCIVLIVGCSVKTSQLKPSSTIALKWNKNHPNDSISNQIAALKWGLSLLGAKHVEAISKHNYIQNSFTISLDIKKLGFNTDSELVFLKLISKFKQTQAYKNNKSIDLGRFLALTLGSSNHYYEITQLPKTFNAFKKQYKFNSVEGYINNSSVSKVHRRIMLPHSKWVKNYAFISSEIDSVSKTSYEFETINVMKNGQLRFGVYNKNGQLKSGGLPSITRAGKPGKCMWCHESAILPLFRNQTDVKGFMKHSTLNDTLNYYNLDLKAFQTTLWKAPELKERSNHTLFEICYISFMEPSAQRLALEWNLPIKIVQKKLQHLQTHVYKEFPFLGQLYYRHEVEMFAPFLNLEVSKHFREFSNNEINYLK